MKRTSAARLWNVTGAPVARSQASLLVNPAPITIECYDNEIPSFVEAEMEKLYENIYSSLAQFRIYGALAGNTSTYVVRQGSRVMAIFLFVRCKETVKVLNEVIRIDDGEISRFAEYVFAAFKKVMVISFHAIQADIRRLRFPYQQVNCSENIVLELPATQEEYMRRLGKHSRKNIKYYMNKLKRTHPTFRFEVMEKGDIRHQKIRDIVVLNRQRMAGKYKVSAYDDAETDRLISLAQRYGMVGVATIKGKVCAGAICLRMGTNYFMSVIAHDSEYDDFRMGTLCCFQTICESIARGGTEFHFLWGRYEYKYTLLGEQRDLYDINVYRSRTRLVANAGSAWKTARAGYIRRAKLWLNHGGGQRSAIGKCINKMMNLVHKVMHARSRLPAGRQEH
jgi:CelD/BcsL family acetyltransferase involved in cellulose biosynthesis